ncbi:MAG TPA: hypothetical protein VG753_02850 [Candidatus Paceibacterota bacterium]|nr:hypothetical protein [Candidatus Paceibacterota bacterium]
MAQTIRDLHKKGLDAVVAEAKARKAELLGKIGDLTVELERAQTEGRKEQQRVLELEAQLSEFQSQVAKLEKELEDAPLELEEQVMGLLQEPFEQMNKAALAEINR